MTGAQSLTIIQIKSNNKPAKDVLMQEYEKDNGECVPVFGAAGADAMDQRVLSYIVACDGSVTYTVDFELVHI